MKKKHLNIKRNHHYVWRHYLKGWSHENDVFYISPKKKIAVGSVKGLAKETDFYKISLLTSEDVEFIKRFSSKSPKLNQKIHMAHLQNFINLSRISERISKLNADSERLRSIDKAIKHNSLEDLHTIIEDSAVKVVSELSKGNKKILNSKNNMVSFCSYLGHQISRTKSFKERSFQAIKSISPSEGVFDRYNMLLEKNWWFLSFMFGVNIGISLFGSKDSDKHIYITNKTDTPFITGDTPIINVHSSIKKLNKYEAPIYADFYFPLSDRYAFMINNSHDYDRLGESIGVDQVNEFNLKIYEKSYITVFASESKVLENLKT